MPLDEAWSKMAVALERIASALERAASPSTAISVASKAAVDTYAASYGEECVTLHRHT